MTRTSFTAMIVLSYTPRDGIDMTAYEEWLRAVDNPFFNGVPGIRHYTNWKITESSAPLPFTHFDFMGLDGLEAADAVWQRQDLKDFTAEWRRLWGRAPDAQDLSANAVVDLFENEAGQAMTPGEKILLSASDTPVADAPAAERWRLVKPLRGRPRFRHLRVRPGPAQSHRPGDLAAERIAGPA